MKQKTYEIAPAATYDIVVNTSGPVANDMRDWPPHIQDKMMAFIEDKAAELGAPLTIVASKCDRDVDTGWFVHLVLQSQPKITWLS